MTPISFYASSQPYSATHQQRQGALRLATIPQHGKHAAINLWELSPKDPHFQEDLQTLFKLYPEAHKRAEAGCAVSKAYAATVISLNNIFDPRLLSLNEQLGGTRKNRCLLAVSDSKLAGFAVTKTEALDEDSNRCDITLLGSWFPKVAGTLLGLIQKEEKPNTTFIACPMPDEEASHVWIKDRLRKLPLLSNSYKRLEPTPWKPELTNGKMQQLSNERLQALGQRHLEQAVIYKEPTSEPLCITGLPS